MPEDIVRVPGQVDGPHFRGILEPFNPELSTVHVQTVEELEAACLKPTAEGGPRRLIAFSTSVIVPGPVLEAVDGPAYNFHPGPPTYPGSHVASFALYEGAENYGATAHVMKAKVDCGTIVPVQWLDIPQARRAAGLSP